MPNRQFNVPIPGIQINRSVEGNLGVFLKCSVILPLDLQCPRCGSKRIKTKAYRVRVLKHAFWAHRLVYLHLRVPKLVCNQCRRYFMAPVPGVRPKEGANG